MKKKVVLFALAAATLSLASCGGNQPAAAKEATGYGVVNGDYISFATMTVKNKKVESVKIDEVFTPYTWASVSSTNATKLGEDAYLKYTSTDWNGEVTKYYAKYILIGGEKFTGSLRDADLVVNNVTYSSEKVKYSSDKTPDLFKSWVESEDACKAYVDYYAANNLAIADKDFKLSTTVLPNFTEGKYKSDGIYWNKLYGAGSGKMGWTGNIAKLEEALVGTSMGASELVKDEETNAWKIDGIATGATITNFKDYYEVCQRAYNKLVK